MAEIPVQRTTAFPFWPWLLGLLLLVGVGLAFWAVSDNKPDTGGASAGAPSGQVLAIVDPPGPNNTTVGIAKATGAGQVLAVGKPAGTDQATVVVVDPVKANETAARAARDAAVTAAILAAELQPMKLAGRGFVLEDASVTEVSTDKIFWVSPWGSNLTYLAVLDTETAAANGTTTRYNLAKDMRLALQGVIQRLDAERAKALALDAVAVNRAGGEGAFYLRVDSINILRGANGDRVGANTDRFDQDRLVVDERIFFGFDSAVLTQTGRAKLDDVAAELKAAGPAWQLLRIKGHADRRGPKDYNMDLSRDRAKAVEGYLATLGVKGGKLDTEAYGESRPFEIDASTPEEYQRNRRVEFTIVRAQ